MISTLEIQFAGLCGFASIGSQTRMNYTVVGDTVNTACHLLNGADPGAILVSENTYERILRKFQFERTEVTRPKELGQISAYVFTESIFGPTD